MISDDREEVVATVRSLLVDVLGLDPARVAAFHDETELFGALPEFDSMAVATLLTEMEERLGILIEDEDVEAEDLMTLQVPGLIVPGQDSSHAPSAARYLEECLPVHEYWDVPVAEQTRETAPARILAFLEQH